MKYILLAKSAAPRLHGMGMAAAGWMTDGRVARRRLDTECRKAAVGRLLTRHAPTSVTRRCDWTG